MDEKKQKLIRITHTDGQRDFARIKLGTTVGSITIEGESDFVLQMFFEVSQGETLREPMREAVNEQFPGITEEELAEALQAGVIRIANHEEDRS